MKEDSFLGITITIPIAIIALFSTGYLGMNNQPLSQSELEHQQYLDALNEQLKDCTWVMITEEWSQQQFLAPKCDGQILYWDVQTNQLAPKTQELTISNLGDTLSLPLGVIKEIDQYHDWCLVNHYVWVMPVGSNFAYCENWHGERVYND